MPLTSGTQLGPYEILSPIGAGGMGEVYKARDTRLDRTVAIKVLPEHVAFDPDLKQRFEREAKTISSLNHPHICTLFDVGEHEGTAFLVMEYLEGDTLAQRLEKGALPLDQALKIAVEIADALDKAHRQGITHRDLKPGNIMLTKAGAKLLDFGLAKLKAPAQSDVGLTAMPTQEAPLTEHGTILGTFQYMAPEQLEGQEADARTDIFAFGAVAFETMTGRKAFTGKTQVSLSGAILHKDPPAISTIQPLAPPALDRVVRKCLAKAADRRWQTAHDLADELRWLAEPLPQTGVATAGAGPSTPAARRWAMPWLVALVAGSVATGVVVLNMRSTEPLSTVKRFAIHLPETDQLWLGGGGYPALSPDGEMLAYVAVRDGVRQVHMRPLDQLEAVPVPGTENAQTPFFSPDAQWLGFVANGYVQRLSLAGGSPLRIAEVPVRGTAVWAPDNTIVMGGQEGPLLRVSAEGGDPRALTTLNAGEGEIGHEWPQIFPDGHTVLFTIWYGSRDQSRAAIKRLDSGERHTLFPGSGVRYLSSGHLVFGRDDSVWAIPFDLERLETTGEAVPVLDAVSRGAQGSTVRIAAADDGALVYIPRSAGNLNSLVWADREGDTVRVTDARGNYLGVTVSPDGSRVAVTRGDPPDIWICETGCTRLTFEGGDRPVWTPDGSKVTFRSSRAGDYDLYWTAADSTGDAERLLARDGAQTPTSWSPDGRVLAFSEGAPVGSGNDVWILPLNGEPEALTVTDADENSTRFSPDGRWMAYQSNESGRWEIYVRRYPGPGAHRSVSPVGGTAPIWSRDSRELYFLEGTRLMVVEIGSGALPRFSAPREVLPGTTVTGRYDVGPDGRFLMAIPLEGVEISDGPANQLILVQNWFDELQRLVPVP